MDRRNMLFQAKRVLAVFLAIVMMVTMLPTNSYAANDGGDVMTKAVTATEEGSTDGGDEIILNTSISLEIEEEFVTEEYTGEAVFDTFDTFRKNIKVTVNEEEIIPVSEDIVFMWKAVGKDGTLTDLPSGEVPINTGNYKLFVELKERKYLYNTAQTEVGTDFIITPTTIKVIPEMTSYRPGTKVSEVEVAKASVVAKNGTVFSYIVDDKSTTDINEAENSDVSINVSVRDAFSGETLSADTILTKDGDYVFDFVPSFTIKGEEIAKGNYTLKEIDSQDVVINNLIPTMVQVTLNDTWIEKGKITYTYTGNEISAPVKEKDYTAKVVYDSGETDAEGNIIYTEIADAQFTESWYSLQKTTEYKGADGNKKVEWGWKETTAPTEAGTYLYRLSYDGLEGIYAPAYTDIMVSVEPMKVVLCPQIKQDAKFYSGMDDEEILAGITYKVLDEQGNEVEIDKTTAWGVSYDDTNATQSYEPIFSLQELVTDVSNNALTDTNDNLVWEENNGEALDIQNKYRVIFTGEKAIYSEYGEELVIYHINQIVNSTELNYMVDTDYLNALNKHAVEIPLMEGTETVIDTSAIIEELGQKGDSLENVYTTVYDGTTIYNDRADYKKAVVKVDDKEVASGADDTLTYTWYKNTNDSITDYFFSSHTNELYTEEEINDFDNPENWNGIVYIPYEAGVYKLHITYDDEVNDEYQKAEADVYYVIEKQKIKAVFSKEFETYTEYGKMDFIYFTGQNPWYSTTIYMITEEGDVSLNWELNKDYYYEYGMEVTPLEEKTNENGEVVKDSNGNPVMIPQTSEKHHYCTVSGNNYLMVDENGTAIIEDRVYGMSDSETFTENAIYRLVPYIKGYDTENYTDWEYVIEDVTIVTDENTKTTETHKVRKVQYLNDKALVHAVKKGETTLKVLVDETKLGNTEKVYDGEGFDLNTLLGDAVKIVLGNDTTKEVTDVNVKYSWYGSQWDSSRGQFVTGYWDSAVDVGEYVLYAGYEGDKKYAPLSDTEIARVKITPATVTVTPVINKDIVAGTTVTNLYYDEEVQNAWLIEGYAKKDEDAFSYANDKYFEAWKKSYINHDIYDEDGNVKSGRLQGNKTYTIQGKGDLDRYYARNYEVEYKKAQFKTVRGNSTVSSGYTHLRYQYFTNELKTVYGPVEIEIQQEEMTHIIKPLEAIPYSYELITGEKKKGNFVEFIITPPAEYYYEVPDTAMYENSIKAVGGYQTIYDGELHVIFDASQKEKKEFDIRWEDGYIEHFVVDFTEVELMSDLTEAVSPKSIKFNGVTTKMMVGEEQALDIKLTKVQKNDVICIAYSVDNPEILSVDEQGNATALKEGKATVTAYPVKIVDGEKVAIEGAKTAKTNITVKAVTAPKIKKVTSQDTKLHLQYGMVKDGYRREIYVLEGKNIKTEVFEEKIASMENGQWQGIFATAPQFIDSKEEANMHPMVKGKSDESTVLAIITGLKPTTQYTVYVRNVSAMRELSDGSKVALSTKGTAKSFTTTKVQITGLDMELNGAEYVEYDEYGNYVDYYKVSLLAGKVNTVSYGYYPKKASNPAAEEGEEIRLSLSLNKADQAVYLNPKLTYTVYDYESNNGKWGVSKLATINKKGKLTLKGVGTVYVEGMDTNTGAFDRVILHIEAAADKVKGNKVKLGVGESMALEELLTYYQGKKKLIGDYAKDVIIDQAIIETFAKNEYFALDTDSGMVTAIKAGGKLQIRLTDAYVQQAGGSATATVTLTSQALDPVKNLRILNTKNLDWPNASHTNNYAFLQFMYDEESGADSFLIEVKDARGRIIRSTYYDREVLDIEEGLDKKQYYYFEIGGLTQQSKYTVAVTAIYDGVKAKPVKCTVKTTKIPVSTLRIKEGRMNSGLQVRVVSEDKKEDINQDKFFISGNTYTLYITAYNSEAEATESDSIIWSSSNKKVATIKANSAGYYATFNALKVGSTVIEAKSKVTKEVVARYEVNVASVGDAYEKGRRFYEDNKPDEYDNPDSDTEDDLSDGTITLPIDNYSEKWVPYTASKDGIYTFTVTNGTSELYKIMGGVPSIEGTSYRVFLEERQEVFLKVKNPYNSTKNITVTVSMEDCLKTTLEKGALVKSAKTTWVRFKAPEDGIYILSTDTDIAYASYWYLYENVNDTDKQSLSAYAQKPTLYYEIKKGEEIYLSVYSSCEEYDCFEVIVDKYQAIPWEDEAEKDITVEDGKKAWIEFKAPETNYYTFIVELPQDTTDVYNKMSLYERVGGQELMSTSDNANNLTLSKEIKKDEKLYVCLESGADGYRFHGTVKITKLPRLTLDEKLVLTTEEYPDKTAWVVFEAPEDDLYVFEPGEETAIANSSIALYSGYNNGLLQEDTNPYGKCMTLYEMKAGETIYLHAEASWSGEETEYGIVVTEFLPTVISENTPVEIKINAGETRWYQFTVSETDAYTFQGIEVEGVENASIYIGLYKSLGDYIDGKYPEKSISHDDTVKISSVLNAEDVVYICVKSKTAGESVDAVLSIMDTPELQLDTEYKIDGEANTSVTKILKFIAPKDAAYSFNITETTVMKTSAVRLYDKVENVHYDNYSVASSSWNGSVSVDYKMKKGDVIYVKTTGEWEGEETSYSVKVSEINIIELQNDTNNEMVVECGKNQWYQFTAPETNCYVITATNNNSGYGYMYINKSICNTSIYRDHISNTQKAEYIMDISEGETIYVYMSSTEYAGCGLEGNIRIMVPIDVTLEEEVVLEGKANEVVEDWLKFTAPKAGVYQIETINDTILSNNTIILKKNVTDSYELMSNENKYGRAKVIYQMEEGETVYINSIASWVGEETSYKLLVSEFTADPMSLDTEVTVQRGLGEYDVYAFTAEEYTTYTFTLTKSHNEFVAVRVYKDADNRIAGLQSNYDTIDCTVVLNPGETVYYYVKDTSGGGFDYTLSVTKNIPVQIDTNIEVETGETNWYWFTAPEDGFYSFVSTTADGEEGNYNSCCLYEKRMEGVRLDYSYDEPDENGIAQTQANVYLYSGESIYLYMTSYCPNTILRVEKCDTTSLDTGSVDTSIMAGGKAYYTYEIKETGVYKVSNTQNATGDDNTAIVKVSSNYHRSDTTAELSGVQEEELLFKKGEVVYIFVTSEEETNYVLQITKQAVNEITAETGVTIPARSQGVWISFTAPEAGYYQLNTVQEQGNTTKLNYFIYFTDTYYETSYSKYSTFYVEIGNQSTAQCSLTAGQTVYWKVNNNNDTDLTINVQAVE